MTDDDRDHVTDRLARRFDEDEQAQNEQKAQSESDERNSMNGTKVKKGENETDEWNVENVKQEWTGKTLYLPDDINDELSKSYKRLDLELDDSLSSLRKTRHFYPLLVAIGKEQMESMESEELIERLESIDPDMHRFL